ncbi:MAG TPA: type II CAAX endopeptidase family protein [Pirellulales bacterium]|nr:type II CAAX endopeptidase family protein [Pirellulales bacterium]
MPLEPPSVNEPPLADAPALPPGRPWIAWGVIVAVAVWIIWHHSQEDPPAKKAAEQRLFGPIADWQARYLVGAAKLFPEKEGRQFATAAPVDNGPIEQRLRAVVVVGEISGPQEATEKLTMVEKALDDVKARETASTLRRVYGDLADGKPALPSLDPADRKRLVDRLGWSGNLALHPANGPDETGRKALLGEAKATFAKSVALFGAIGVLGLGGLGALLSIVVLLLVRPQSRRLASPTQHGGVYAETFAVWMVLYLGLSFAAGYLPVGQNRLLLTAAVMLASLAALGWPVLRGIPWQVVRDEMGLYLGRWPLVELALGPMAYLAALPLLVIGVIVIAVLLAIQRAIVGDTGTAFDQNLPSHPIVGWLLGGDWWQKAQVIFLASVMAPLMEETMFRGALYRHLRDVTHRFVFATSVLTSGLGVSFLFAVIHPQGWIAVPVLMALALAFALIREWRGTLLAAMLAHGINNLVVTCVLISI